MNSCLADRFTPQAAPESLGTYGQADQASDQVSDEGEHQYNAAGHVRIPRNTSGRHFGPRQDIEEDPEINLSIFAVPDNAFTIDSQSPSSYDSNSLSEPVDQDYIVDLTDLSEKYVRDPDVAQDGQAEANEIGPGTEDASVVELVDAVQIRTEQAREEGPASVLPPVQDLTDTEYNKINDITLELIQDEAVESATTPGPVLFTYAPEATEGPANDSTNRFARFAKGLKKLDNKRLYYKLLINDFYGDNQDKLFTK